MYWGIGEISDSVAHVVRDRDRHDFDHHHLLQRFLLNMQTLWIPGSFAFLFRRVVNVVYSLSISQQYLLPRLQLGDDGANVGEDRLRLWEGFKAIRWSSWTSGDRSLSSSTDTERQAVDVETPTHPPHHDRPQDTIHQLIHSPVLYDPVRRPRNPIALCHGELLQAHYEARFLRSTHKVCMASTYGDRLPSLYCKCTTGRMY